MLKVSLECIFLAYLFWGKMIICMLCCGRTPIEFVKIGMNCYSGLCIAISDHPQTVTCQLRSN